MKGPQYFHFKSFFVKAYRMDFYDCRYVCILGRSVPQPLMQLYEPLSYVIAFRTNSTFLTVLWGLFDKLHCDEVSIGICNLMKNN